MSWLPCQHCQGAVAYDLSQAGEAIRCPHCQEKFPHPSGCYVQKCYRFEFSRLKEHYECS